jgi:hypothetical protein
MRPTRHITTPIALALTLVVGLGLAPVAQGDPAPLAKAEAAIAASQSLRPIVQPNPDEQVQWSRAQSPMIVRVVASDGGFDWGDASAGAAAGVALSMLALGLALAVSQLRARRSKRPAAMAN